MSRKRANVNLDDLRRRHHAGETVQSIAKSLAVSRSVIVRRLVAVGIRPRSNSEAQIIRNQRLTIQEHLRYTAAAHAACRGKRHSFEHRCKIAAAFEAKQVNVGPAELRLASMLRRRGWEVICQKAVGRYNLDVVLPEARVAVEIFGGHWHTADRHARRFRQRTDYILNQGWTLLVVWVTRDYPLQAGAVNYIIAVAQPRRGRKPRRGQQHMIRGDGQLTAIGQSKFNHRSAVIKDECS